MDRLQRQSVTIFIAAVVGVLAAAGSAYSLLALAFISEADAAILFFGLLALLPWATLFRTKGGAEGTVFATVAIALLASAALGMLSETIFVSIAVLGAVVLGVLLLRSRMVGYGMLASGAGLVALGAWDRFPDGMLLGQRLVVGGAALASLAVVFLLRRRQTDSGTRPAP